MIMKLEEFESLDKKQEFFEKTRYDLCDKEADFDKWYDEMKNKSDFVFRGIYEAKFRLYTTGQREWLENNLQEKIKYRDFISGILDETKNNRFLENYISTFGIVANDLFYMSYLQHYGAPTPLLDFSYSLNTSLFFALEKLNNPFFSCTNSINKYFSVYYVELNDSINFFNNVEFFTEFGVEIPQKLSTNFFTRTIDPKKIHDNIFDNDVLFIPNPLRKSNLFTTDIYWANLNLVAQDGCFFLYQDEAIPFEEYLMTKNYPVIKIHCVDIHKSLADYVREKTGLSRKDVYPELKDLALESYETFKKELK